MLDTDLLLRYECEEISFDETVELFQQIYDSEAYKWLQGHYGRVLNDLIEEGYIKV